MDDDPRTIAARRGSISNILLDTCAIEAMATAEAQVVRQVLADRSLTPCATLFAVGEVLHGVVKNQFGERTTRNCRFLANLPGLHLDHDVPQSLWHELTGPPLSWTRAYGHPYGAEMLRHLREAGIGAVPPHLASLAGKFFSSRRATYDTMESELAGWDEAERDAYRSADWVDLKSSPAFERIVLHHANDTIAENGGRWPGAHNFESIVERARLTPSPVPLTTGTARAMLWANKRICERDKLAYPLRMDTYFLPWALTCDLVLTTDTKLREIGRDVFPEVEWPEPQAFMPELRVWTRS